MNLGISKKVRLRKRFHKKIWKASGKTSAANAMKFCQPGLVSSTLN